MISPITWSSFGQLPGGRPDGGGAHGDRVTAYADASRTSWDVFPGSFSACCEGLQDPEETRGVRQIRQHFGCAGGGQLFRAVEARSDRDDSRARGQGRLDITRRIPDEYGRNVVVNASQAVGSFAGDSHQVRPLESISTVGADRQIQQGVEAEGGHLHTGVGRDIPELQAAAIAFNRANRSAIRAEHRAADALRQAGRTLLTAPTGRDGDFVAAALASAVFLLIALSEWHAQRGHEQQAAAAQQSLVHLRAAQQHAARPALAQLAARAPSPQARDRLAAAVRAMIPEHAYRILADPAWPALSTALARAESAGTPPRQTLADLSRQRELDTADRPAEVLVWHLRTATAERVSQRARSAATRSARNNRLTTETGAPSVPAVQPQPTDVKRLRPGH